MMDGESMQWDWGSNKPKRPMLWNQTCMEFWPWHWWHTCCFCSFFLLLLFFKNIYLFIWLCLDLVAAGRILAGVQGLSSNGACTRVGSVELGLLGPEHAGSVLATPGLTCPMARGSLDLQPGIKATYSALHSRFPITEPQGKSYTCSF